MSISLALASALSGLKANARQAEAVSSNVANATTPGYAKRSIALSALELGGAAGGVRVTGVVRHADLYLLNDRRNAQAAAADLDQRAAFLSRIEAQIGDSEAEGSLTSRMQGFESSLILATANPASSTALSSVVDAAQYLVQGINSVSDQIQLERQKADHAIAIAVANLNTGLQQIADLNRLIASHSGSGSDTAALMDQRQQIIDQLSSVIPLKEVPRSNNTVALIASNGAIVLDGTAAEFSFRETPTIVAEMSLESGALSGLLMNGKPVTPTASGGLLAGGGLAAQFAIRDDLAPAAQASLDALARNMIERYANSGADPTLIAGQSGLFTDGAASFDPTQEQGVAGRLRLNPLVVESQGGAAWRLRDGLGAGVQAAVGDSTLLNALANLISTTQTVSTTAISGSFTLTDLAAAVLSQVSSERVSAETQQAYANSRYTALTDLEAQDAVNVDDEMSALLVIEKSYAANAKVIQTVDALMRILLEI